MAVFMPAANDVHVNKMLTDVSVGYRNSEYIADQIFPMVMVTKQTDIIPFYKQSAFFRDEAGVIGEGGKAPQAGYEVDTSNTYYCAKYGIKHFISDDRRANEDAPFNSDQDATFLVTDKLMLRRERAFVADFWKTSVWGTDKTGTTNFVKWSDYGSSSPIEDIREFKRTVRRKVGVDPNTLVLGDLTADRLLDHPDVLDRIKYTERGIASADLLAALFGVDRVLIGKSVYTADEEGLAEASVTYTASWDDDALLLYVPPRPSLFTPSAGYTFVWQTPAALGSGPQWVRKWHEEEEMGDYIEARSYFDQKACATNAGLFMSDCTD